MSLVPERGEWPGIGEFGLALKVMGELSRDRDEGSSSQMRCT